MAAHMIWLLMAVTVSLFSAIKPLRFRGFRLQNNVKQRSILPPMDTFLSSTTSIVENLDTFSDSGSKFDIATAVILAAYAFESYNEPSIGKVSKGTDGCDITFMSSDFIRSFFNGVVMITLRKGKLIFKEDQLLERMATGAHPDPYVIMTLQDGTERQVDNVVSSVKANTADPVWDETFFLYVKDASIANLTFTVMDKDLYKEDDFIGTASLSIADVAASSSVSVASTTTTVSTNVFNEVSLPVPVYAPSDPGTGG
eukprot:gene8169-16790_t